MKGLIVGLLGLVLVFNANAQTYEGDQENTETDCFTLKKPGRAEFTIYNPIEGSYTGKCYFGASLNACATGKYKATVYSGMITDGTEKKKTYRIKRAGKYYFSIYSGCTYTIKIKK